MLLSRRRRWFLEKKNRYIRFLYSAGIETSQLEHRRSKKRIVAVLKESIECSRKKLLFIFLISVPAPFCVKVCHYLSLCSIYIIMQRCKESCQLIQRSSNRRPGVSIAIIQFKFLLNNLAVWKIKRL